MENVDQLNPQALAFVGDAVYSLWVRARTVATQQVKTADLHKRTSDIVKASAQAQALTEIEGLLTPDEQDIARRARNAHTANHARNATMAEYHKATAFEAVIGYLYLKGDSNRLYKLLDIAAGLAPASEQQELEKLQSLDLLIAAGKSLNNEQTLEYILGAENKDIKE